MYDFTISEAPEKIRHCKADEPGESTMVTFVAEHGEVRLHATTQPEAKAWIDALRKAADAFESDLPMLEVK